MKKGLILSAVLFLPVTIYLIFSLGVPKVKPAPVFGPREAVEVTRENGRKKIDTLYYHIPAFNCTTVEGRLFSSQKLGEKLYVACFVQRDSIGSLFGLLVQDLKLNKSKWAQARFLFFQQGDSLGQPPPGGSSLATDIPFDSVQTVFLSPTAFDTLRDKHYFIPTPGLKKQPWQSTSDLVLIDGKGRIRGYYSSRSAAQLKLLKEDVPHVLFHDEALETLEQSTIKQERKK